MAKKTIVRGPRSMVLMVALVAVLGFTAGEVAAADPDGVVGPDVVVFDLHGTSEWGEDDGIRAYSVGTVSCNRGDEDLDWISNTNQHPVIAQNVYRVTLPDPTPPVEHGKIEMLGISWLKHGFVSLNLDDDMCGNCTSGAGSFLGVGCTDPYSSGLNGSQSNLGPRYQVNAFTGYFPYPYTPSQPSGHPDLAGRVQIKESELIEDPSSYRYFIEGQYVSPDDAAAGNGFNNASHREVYYDDLSHDLDLDSDDPTIEGMSGIYAWQTVDPTVTVREVLVPNEGMFVVAYKVGNNGDGTWHYDYAVFNLNSHLSGANFSVPILPSSVITNIGFRDVDYHSGEPHDPTDWAADADPGTGWMTWSSVPFPSDPDNANALRWSTMYSFSFDADSPPEDAIGSIGLFRTGGPSSVSVYLQAPANNTNPLFEDDFESGDLDAWGMIFP